MVDSLNSAGRCGLGSHFELRECAALFSATESAQRFLGWEIGVVPLRFSSLERILPGNNVIAIPVGQGFPSTILVANLLLRMRADAVVDSLWLDWPVAFEDQIPHLLKFFPANLVAGPKGVVEQEVLQSGDGNPALDTVPLLFVEAMDASRFLACALRERGQVGAILPFGTHQRLLQKEFERKDAPWWSGLPMSSGLVPWLDAVLGEAGKGADEKVCGARFLSHVLRSSDGVHIVAGTPESLIHLARAVEKLIGRPGNSSGTALDLEVARERKALAWTRGALGIARVDDRSASELARVCGFLSRGLFADWSTQWDLETDWLDRFGAYWSDAYRSAATRYESWTRLAASPSQQTTYFRYAYRLARDLGMLFPVAFDMVLAAQAVIDSNFSFEMVKECETFPPVSETTNALPELRIPLESLTRGIVHFSISRFETIQAQRFRRKKLSASGSKNQRLQLPQEPVTEDKYSDNSWLEEEHPYSCSFPEEDIFMENFAFHYREQARERIRAREVVVHEIGSSLEDGLDIRATARDWHLGKLMVREELNVGRADVGSVIFQFADPAEDDKYSWLSYWLAEQHDKSDLMFYATAYRDCVVGPGIAKSEFGGFAVIPLPNYLANPWHDPFLRHVARRPADALLIAGALATDHRSILYIGDYAPSRDIIQLIKRSGKSVITMRLDELPPDKIRRLRTFHILAEAGVRGYAHKYIRKD